MNRTTIALLAAALVACGSGTTQLVEFPDDSDGAVAVDAGGPVADSGSHRDGSTGPGADSGKPVTDASGGEDSNGGDSSSPSDSGAVADTSPDVHQADAGRGTTDSGCGNTCQDQYEQCVCQCESEYAQACNGKQQCLDRCACELRACEGEDVCCTQ